MAQTGFTPIVTYNTATATTVPSAANLAQGELAVNVTDKKLYTKDSGGNVVLLASNGGDATGPASSTNLAIPTFSGTGGKTLLNNSGVTITAGVITATGFSGPLNGSLGATTPSTVKATTVNVGGGTLGQELTVKAASSGINHGIGLISSSNSNLVGVLQDNVDEGLLRLYAANVENVLLRGGDVSTFKLGITAPITALGNVHSGSYTPTISGTVNLTATTAFATAYMRVGNVVTVAGRVQIDPTIAGVITFVLTLPINSAMTGQPGGGTGHSGTDSFVFAPFAANQFYCSGVTTNTADHGLFFSFTYEIN